MPVTSPAATPGSRWKAGITTRSALATTPDAHRYRVGVTHTQTDVSGPRCPIHSCQRDGQACFYGNGRSAPVYQPNRFGGPADDASGTEPPLHIDGDADRYDHRYANESCTQAGDLCRLMDAEAQ
ncbi:MAG: catalase [Gammaproteobacteria bacterium]|nr:catalase [Gammaproteobacteria bacterium]